VTARLDEFLERIVADDRRKAERSKAAPAEAEAVLRRCGVQRLTPGEASIGSTCVAYLSAGSRELRVAVLLGLVPFAASLGRPDQVPQFAVAPDAPDYGVSLMWWNGTRWAVEGLQYSLAGQSLSHPVLDALAARLSDRASVHVLQTYVIDFQYYPDGVDNLGPFLVEAEQHAAALIGGKLLPGLRGTAARLDR